MNQKDHFLLHPDDEWIDEIRIRIAPRYKTSGLSGDEWRVKAVVEFFRKGKVLETRSYSKIQWAVMALGNDFLNSHAPGGNFGPDLERVLCMQPGCAEPAVTTYRYRKFYSNGGQASEPPMPTFIRFCGRHARRGDAGLEDGDDNYELVSGPGPDQADVRDEDESPAIFGGVIDLRDGQ